ncbi:MAG: hypothetical protein GY792_32705 [Gammaproteobacteria bacterium]|nr:hypothetical protein [Gammaproteobacteria bacterium]
MTSPKSRTFERPVLPRELPLVVWASMASHRPERPLVHITNCVRCAMVTGHRLEIVPSGNFLIFYLAAPDTNRK